VLLSREGPGQISGFCQCADRRYQSFGVKVSGGAESAHDLGLGGPVCLLRPAYVRSMRGVQPPLSPQSLRLKSVFVEQAVCLPHAGVPTDSEIALQAVRLTIGRGAGRFCRDEQEAALLTLSRPCHYLIRRSDAPTYWRVLDAPFYLDDCRKGVGVVVDALVIDSKEETSFAINPGSPVLANPERLSAIPDLANQCRMPRGGQDTELL
jgi:hypothetical protein